MNNYLHTQVNQDIKRRLAACFVALDDKDYVIGYYTLSSESLGRETIPIKHKKKVPQNYNAPVILLGRLARDLKFKSSGLGEHLLIDALFRSFALSEESIGAMAVVTYPISEHAVNFYSRYGFVQLPDSGRMFLPMSIISQLI